jgi:predicted permease
MSLPPDLLVLSNNYTVEGTTRDSAGPSGVAEWNVVSPGFFSTMQIPILRGRAFETIDHAQSPRVGIVNEAFVRRHFPGQDPIGRRLKGGDWSPQSPWITIVGVAGDVAYENGVMGGSSPTMYTAYAQNLWWQAPYVLIKTERESAGLANAVRAVVTSLDPRVPIRDPATMTERLHRSTSIPRLRAMLFSTLGVLALLLGVTGIYGVMAYHVNQRRRETAIRRALGARGDQIVLTTLTAGLRLAGAGIAIGTVGALALTQSLSTLLYGVNPRDPAVLSGTMTLLVAAAVIACAWPANRAARVDPATLLRED